MFTNPKPISPAGENSKTILEHLPGIVRLYHVRFVNYDVFHLWNIRAQPGATIHYLPNFVLLSSHDFYVNILVGRGPQRETTFLQ